MPASRSTRPDTTRGLALPRVDSPALQRALDLLADALREEQRDPKLPRVGAGGDVFYRAADGRLYALSIGAAGEVLTVADGLPAWAPSSGGGGSAGSCVVDVDFGAAISSTEATTTVTGQAWVTASSRILVSASGESTADHDPEDALIEGVTAIATNLVAGVGFDVIAHSPDGSSGTYRLWAVGA